MSYQEADKLSKKDKEFIRNLFPDGDIYASLLPQDAQDVIGRAGPGTQAVEKLLTRIGFRYMDRVDPFDGGPYYSAKTDEVAPVRAAAERFVGVGKPGKEAARALLGLAHAGPPWFTAVPARFELQGEKVITDEALLGALRVDVGAKVWVLPD
jgi:arginine N-succinyltransferase